MSKCPVGIGFHQGEPSHSDGIGDYWGALAGAGHALMGMGADTGGPCYNMQIIKKSNPDLDVHAIWRKTEFTWGSDTPIYHADPKAHAKRYWDEIDGYDMEGKPIDGGFPDELDKDFVWVSFPNEPDRNESEFLGHLAYWSGMEALERGYRFVCPAWSLGNPEPDDWRYFQNYLQLCEKHPDRLGIVVHEYTESPDVAMLDTVPYLIGRVQALNDYCRLVDIALPVVYIKEWGWGANDAPHKKVAVPQIIETVKWYIENASNVKGVAIWCLDKGWQWSSIARTVNGYMEPLAQAILAEDWPQPDSERPPEEKPPVEEKVKKVIFKYAEEHTPEEAMMVFDKALKEYFRTTTRSMHDAVDMIRPGNKESYIRVFDPELPSQVKAVEYIKAQGFDEQYEVDYLKPPPPTYVDLYRYRPCDTARVTQWFMANPQNYQKFGLPGHDGIDYGVSAGKAYYAVNEGEVVWASEYRPSGGKSAWGWHVIIRHEISGNVFHTVYAHATANLPVKKGDTVRAGQRVGFSGNTGNSSGYHLHINHLVPDNPGNGFPKWTFGYAVDPWPYLKGKDAPPQEPSQATLDLLSYMRGDGRMYEVRHPDGQTETFQTQRVGDFWYQVKNSQWEEFFTDGTHIWRGRDTSPGPAPSENQGGVFALRPGELRMYDQFESGKKIAKWCKRRMYKGEKFFGPGHQVQFRYKSDCLKCPANSGGSTNIVTFVDKHNRYEGYNGVIVEDVIELKNNFGESMFFGRGWGLVGWGSDWGSSKICEVHQGRPDLVRERIHCA